jgi:hypothetical protein
MTLPKFQPFSYTLENLFAEEWPMYTDQYQRDYAWEEDELQDFVNDITQLYHRRGGDEADTTHFFGAIVAIDRSRLPNLARSSKEIVDGQQRLTTFSLTIAAIISKARDLKSTLESTPHLKRLNGLIDSLNSAFLMQREKDRVTFAESDTRMYRTTDRDAPVFEALMDGKAPPIPDANSRDSHRLLLEAMESLRKNLVEALSEDSDAEASMERLIELRRILMEGCQFVFISTQSRQDATQLFSVLNDRGRRLEEADLLRTYTLMLADEASADTKEKIARAWDGVDRWPRLTVDAFLRHHYASVVGDRVSSANLFRDYRSVFFQGRDEPFPESEVKVVVKFVESLSVSMALYEPISRGEWPFPAAGSLPQWDRDRLHRIVRVLGSERAFPLLLSAASRGNDHLGELVPHLERLEFRTLVAGVEQNAVANMYFDVAALIRAESFQVGDAVEEIETWIANWADDSAFAAGIEKRLVYGSYKNNNYIKHLLTTINDFMPWFDRKLSGEPKPPKTASWDLGRVQIEHIYPQSPEKGVPAQLEGAIHRLGNLTFWGPDDNREATNHLPTSLQKVSAYKSSEVELTKRVGRQLAASKQWRLKQIAKREQGLLEQAETLFGVDGEAAARAVKLRRRRSRLFYFREGKRRIWLVATKPESGYEDTAGDFYHYPSHIPNGKQVSRGDILLLFKPLQSSRKRAKIPGKPARLVAIGLVDRIEYLPGGARKAHYANYLDLPSEVPLGDPSGGEDPRSNKRNAMNAVSESYLDELYALTGVTVSMADLDAPPSSG